MDDSKQLPDSMTFAGVGNHSCATNPAGLISKKKPGRRWKDFQRRPGVSSGFEVPQLQNRTNPLISRKRGELPAPTNEPRRLVGGPTAAIVEPNSGLLISFTGWSKFG